MSAMELLNYPGTWTWLAVVAVLAAALVAVFYFGSWFERRGPGPVSAEQAVAGAE